MTSHRWLTAVSLAAFFGVRAALGADPAVRVVPRPGVVNAKGGTFLLDGGTAIFAPDAGGEASLLAAALRASTGLPLPVTADAGGRDKIWLRLDKAKPGPEGAYTLDATADGVVITASTTAGLFYGAQTLQQLLPPEAFSPTPVSGVAWAVPLVHIEDAPHFAWRGLMLDCTRHFFSVDFVERFIDTLSRQKMNTFHWHLTDDQGWRIEIKKYPRLTEVGSVRAGNRVPDPAAGPRKSKVDPTPYGGFYTQDQVRQVVAYAAARHVTVVPEIEMPGHAAAAIAAYPWLAATTQPVKVRVDYGVEKHIVNPNERTIGFYQDVLGEVMGLFPSTFIHTGGDEAPKADWDANPEIQAQIKRLGLKNSEELQGWFTGQMDKFLAQHGRRLIGWDEILEGGLSPGATVMSWRGPKGAASAAKLGHDTVNASNGSAYLDYYQSKDVKNEPYAIGGFLPLKTVYAFNPVPAGLTAEQAAHVLGGQGQLWTEWIGTPDYAEYMLYPRACALAEVLWSGTDGKDFGEFVDRLATHVKRLSFAGVKFRPLDPPAPTTRP